MKMMPRFLTAVCALTLLGGVVCPPSAWARDVYVAVDGSDDHPGTQAQPFKSIQHAVDRAEPGDVIRVGPGAYQEHVQVRRSGAEGAPITIEGARGPDGERLTRLDAGEPVAPETWQPAPDIGPNVFKNESFGYEPKLLTVDGLYVAHAHRDNWTATSSDTPEAGRPMTILAWPEDHQVTTSSQHKVEVPFWDTMGGVYAYNPDKEGRLITYLRLARGVDPRERDVAISPGGPVVTIDNASHIVLRGLEIARGEVGVTIQGGQANHNLVEDCRITHGRIRVLVANKASHNTIRNCHIAMAFAGARPGAWGGDTIEAGVCEYLYNFFKRLAGPAASSDDRAITVNRGARHTTIVGNHLDGGLVAITSSSNEGLVVRDNIINDFSSVGLSIITGSVDARFHDNLIYNCNKNIRLHRLNQGDGYRVYIYRNRLFQPDGRGEHIYTHAHTEQQLKKMGITEYEDPEVTVYHNTFVGGPRFFSLTTRLRNEASKFRFINNVISTRHPFRWIKNDTVLGVFDYNWVGGEDTYEGAEWFGEHNVAATGQLIGTEGELPDFRLPPDSAARNAGIDLSQPFTIDGQTYEPLPGMEPGYFRGEQPDMGAIQHDDAA